jgi:hypothetical protein
MADIESMDNWSAHLYFKIPKEVQKREIDSGLMSGITFDSDPNYQYGCFAQGETKANLFRDINAKIKSLESTGRIVDFNGITITHRIVKKITVHSKEELDEVSKA